MNLKPVDISMDIEDVQALLGIVMDEDHRAALDFIKMRLLKKVEQKLHKR